jgi:hypothetical protein
MLGFIWFCVCVVGFFMHSEALDKQGRARADKLGRVQEDSGWWMFGVFLLWVFIWQMPYGLLVTSGMPDGGAYPY